MNLAELSERMEAMARELAADKNRKSVDCVDVEQESPATDSVGSMDTIDPINNIVDLVDLVGSSSPSQSPPAGPVLRPEPSTESKKPAGADRPVSPALMDHTVQCAGQSYPARLWRPDEGHVGSVLSYDTETFPITDPGTVPAFVLASVFNGQVVYFVGRDELGSFWETHRDSRFVMHSAAFDIAVTEQACGFDLHALVEANQILDIAILARLCGLAAKGSLPQTWRLDYLANELLGTQLDKNEQVRTGFGRYLQDGHTRFGLMGQADFDYAGSDAIVTFQIGQRLCVEVRRLRKQYALSGALSHSVQLRADIALREIERNGLSVDLQRVAQVEQRLRTERESALVVLGKYGYVPGRPGVKKRYGQIIRRIEKERGVRIRVTPKSRQKSEKAEHLAPLRGHEFVDAFLQMKEAQKLLSTFIRPLRESGGRIHPNYGLLTVTGRTRCSSPNLQQMPRKGGIRECIVPAPGYALIAADYAGVELCGLAQITFSRYGGSRMRELINMGTDLHAFVAAELLHKPVDLVTPDERQKAKALNFGIPGGMGPDGLCEYARSTYGVEMGPEEAAEFRRRWLEIFPEVSRYLRDRGSYADTAITSSGRVRAHCSYTELHNTPFQGAAADGAKLAIYGLVRAGYRVVGFIHDEVLVEVPDAHGLRQAAEDIRAIMIGAMREVCPDVRIDVEFAAMRRWSKQAKARWDEAGRLIPYDDVAEQESRGCQKVA